VRIIVDLVRCQSYGQCVYAAPTVFRFNGEESLEFDYVPNDALREQVERPWPPVPSGHSHRAARRNLKYGRHSRRMSHDGQWIDDERVFSGRIVVVGAYWRGCARGGSAAQAGFAGPLTLIGDERFPPYDGPPLSKTVLSGWLPWSTSRLPQFVRFDADGDLV
jgi:ferredoxin